MLTLDLGMYVTIPVALWLLCRLSSFFVLGVRVRFGDGIVCIRLYLIWTWVSCCVG